jgi:hypothetical protein
MPTPEGKTEGKVERKDIPEGSYINMGGSPEDRLPTPVSQIPKTLDMAAYAAFLIGCVLTAPIKDFHWFLYLAFALWGAAVGFWLASRMAQSAIFLQSNRDQHRPGKT